MRFENASIQELFKVANRVGRNEKIEEIIMTKYPEFIFRYADIIIGDRWPEAEHIIMRMPKYAFLYAMEILYDRWPEAEQYIMEDPYYAYLYAHEIIQGRWEEAEDIIMRNTHSALAYAYEILEHKWIEAEEYMNGSDKENEKHYVRTFYGEGETLNNIRMKRDLEKMLSF